MNPHKTMLPLQYFVLWVWDQISDIRMSKFGIQMWYCKLTVFIALVTLICVATKVQNFQYIKRAAIFWHVSQILQFSNLITKAYQACQICDMSHKYMSSYSGSVIQNIRSVGVFSTTYFFPYLLSSHKTSKPLHWMALVMFPQLYIVVMLYSW